MRVILILPPIYVLCVSSHFWTFSILHCSILINHHQAFLITDYSKRCRNCTFTPPSWISTLAVATTHVICSSLSLWHLEIWSPIGIGFVVQQSTKIVMNFWRLLVVARVRPWKTLLLEIGPAGNAVMLAQQYRAIEEERNIVRNFLPW